MAKANNKTVANDADVLHFLHNIDDSKKKEDALQILDLMKEITGESPTMWGTSIIGFGQYRYKYESGREGDFMKVGFSPRKQNLSIYIIPGFDRYDELMSQLGKHRTGRSCLYIKKLSDIDENVLRELIHLSYDYMTNKYG